MQRETVTVGDDSSLIRGFTNRHIQCAVDHVSAMGGGTVALSAGVFDMADALHLRTGVTVRGQGDATVLRKRAMKTARIVTFHGFGHNDLEVDTPDVFALGDGIIVSDDNSFGFYQTAGTLVARDGAVWYLDRPYAHDYLGRSNGVAKTLYPLVSAVGVDDAAIEAVLLDGNTTVNATLNGCRGGAFFAHNSNRIRAAHVRILEFNGEGFSFQTCDDMELSHCIAERCHGNGFHPGSGSRRFRIHDCISRNNTACGLFYCLHVRDSVLEDCVFEDNGGQGVYIGNRDCRHVNRRLTIRRNGGAGIAFSETDVHESPHGNLVEDCVLEDNCRAKGSAELVLAGAADGVRLVRNRIRPRAGVAAIHNPGTMTNLVIDRTPLE